MKIPDTETIIVLFFKILVQVIVLIRQICKYIKSKYYRIRYNIWKAWQIKISDYIFLDRISVFIFLGLLTLNFCLYYKHIDLEVRFLTITEAVFTIETLLKSTIVFLSILFSFTLLAFQISNKYFGRYAFIAFFKSKHLKIMFTLFLINISFLIYVYLYLKGAEEINTFDSYGKLIFIESLVFSFFYALSIFPVMIDLLSISQSRNNLKKLFDDITDDEILHSEFIIHPFHLNKFEERDSFKIILELGLVAMKDYDHTTFDLLIKNMYTKFKNAKDITLQTNLFYKFRDVLLAYFEFGIKEKNSTTLRKILSCRTGMEELCVVAKPPIIIDYNSQYNGWDYNFDMERYYNKAIQYNEDEICGDIVDDLRDHLKLIITGIYPDNFTYDYSNPYDMKMTRYTMMLSHIYSLIEKFIKGAGKLKKILILKNISNLFSTIDLVIVESKNHEVTKQYLLQVNNLHKNTYLRALVEDAQNKNIEFLFHPYGLAIQSEISTLNTAIIFKGSLNAFDYLFQHDALTNMVINELKAYSMGFIHNYNSKPTSYRKLLILAIDKFDYTRNLINAGDSNYRKETYLKLSRYLGYVYETYQHANINDEELNNKFSSTIANFTRLSEFEEQLRAVGYIQNVNLI